MNHLFALLCVALICIPALAASPSGLPIDDFPISYWCGPTEKFTTLERYQEIKDANFTFVMPPMAPATAEHNRKVLDLCQKVGLKAILADGRMPMAVDEKAKKALDAIVADYSQHPAFLGYYVVDEPSAAAFAGLGQVVDYLKQRDPAHPPYINLFPNYANAEQLGTSSYEDHIRQYLDKVKTPVLSYDHYHYLKGGDRPGFVENLDVVRRVCDEKNVPFWQIVLCLEHLDYRNPTEGELRYEAMHTLAYGAKGLLWFTYWATGELDKQYFQHAVINTDGTRDPHYDMIKRINADVRRMGKHLLNATCTQVVPSGKDTPYVRGIFRSATLGNLMLVASSDYRNGVEARIVSRIEGAKHQQLDANGQWRPLALDGKELRVKLAPGDAALIRW